MPDGPNLTVDATQPLAARGMAVFQAGVEIDGGDTQFEGFIFVTRIDAAVETWWHEGSFDPK